MSTYKLTINLETQDVKDINVAQQRITMVKKVGGSSGSKVAWVSFNPFEHNEVTWDAKYGIYASSTTVQNGSEIYKTSAVNPAICELSYPFENGTFSAPVSGDTPNAYGIKNQYSQQFTFGLAQSVTANGCKFDASPLNAVPVLSMQTSTFTPIEKIEVFLHSNFNNGVVISDITSKALELDFTNDQNITIRYDKTVGQFVIA
jgi:hypothetical protein